MPDLKPTHHTGGVQVLLCDGSVRNSSNPDPVLAGVADQETSKLSGYLFTTISHTARDVSYDAAPSSEDYLFGDAQTDARYNNGLVSRFSAGENASYEGAHALYQDFVVPTGQISDGTSNTIMFAEAHHIF